MPMIDATTSQSKEFHFSNNSMNLEHAILEEVAYLSAILSEKCPPFAEQFLATIIELHISKHRQMLELLLLGST